MGELIVLIALFAGVVGIVNVTTDEKDCKVISGDQLGNMECEKEE